MDIIRRSLLVAATLTSGLSAGLLFAFACSVMPALAGAEDDTFVVVMQRVNVAIINGWFLLVFVGALVFGVLSVLTHLGHGHRGPLAWAVAGVLLYVAALVVTGVVNVPLNDALAAAGSTAASDARAAFESRWVTWNIVRTVAAAAAVGCFAWALTVAGPG